MIFKFICPRCGEYEVSENTFRAILSPELLVALDERIQRDPHLTPIAEFGGGCQHEGCEPGIEHAVELRVRS